MSIKSYRNAASRDVAEGIGSKSALKLLPLVLQKNARRALLTIDSMTSLNELRAFPGWRLEKLKGDRNGQFSIRINQQYRICFNWNGIDASNVEIVDYH